MIVRWADISGCPTDDPTLASASRRRLTRLRDHDDRRRFVGARRLLVRSVAEFTGVDGADVSIEQRCPRCHGDDHGRPSVLVAGEPGPDVSMSHAGSVAVVAVGASPIGVDVEPLDRPGRPLEPSVLVDWVRHEAVHKALNLGIDIDPTPFQLGPADQAPRLDTWTGNGPTPKLVIADLELTAGYVAALAEVPARSWRPTERAAHRSIEQVDVG